MKAKSEKVSKPMHGNSFTFAFYHQNEALLFQFLLHECLLAHQILRKKPSDALILQLVGKLDNHSPTWHAPIGHLPRLYHYCTLLETHFNNPASLICNHLGKSLEYAFHLAKKCCDSKNKDEKQRDKYYAELRKEMRTFLKILFEKAHEFSDNASVLYFLLKHQEQFDTIYRTSIIKKTFATFFPGGMKEAYVFFVEKFSKKGFHHLIPSIEQKLKNLEDEPRLP